MRNRRDYAHRIVAKISNEVPVLVHSINPMGARNMRRKLEGAGFDVTISPMTNLTYERFNTWLLNALELWKFMQEDA